MIDHLWALPMLAIVFALGASIGSFANVVIYRLPAGRSLLHPPSRCPHCGHTLGKGENIPVLGWLRLKGRCAHCHAPISPRYPIVEAVTGLLFLGVFLRYQVSLTTFGYWLFLTGLLILALIDWDTMILPNPLTRLGVISGLLYHCLQGWQGDSAIGGLMQGIFGAVLGIWLVDAVRFLGSLAWGKETMGAGDGKLLAAIGAWLGPGLMVISGFLGAFLGAVIGTGAIALGLLRRSQPMPFGPFLALGGAIAAIWGETLLKLYLEIFFPAGVL